MGLIIRILVTAILVMLIANFMPGVSVDSFMTSIVVAIVLGLLNLFVKPILVLFTLPVTFITLGLFLLVINAAMIMLCARLVEGFGISGFWTALFFSIILSVLQSLTFAFTDKDK